MMYIEPVIACDRAKCLIFGRVLVALRVATGVHSTRHLYSGMRCQECGVTLCCDNSPNQHATRHARATAHPVIASAEAGERWLYCYVDEQVAEY